jgi:YegS/Rv2252/BmrU family lipid kinase
MAASWLAIVNPAAGGGRCGARATQALERLRASGLEVQERRTHAPGEASRIARDAYATGVRAFIAVGGDGTAYELVNGLLPEALTTSAAERPCVGFLPLGTGNSFLRDFGQGGTEAAIEALVRGRRRSCDVLRLEHQRGALHAINLLSAGFVADVATVANRRFKRLGAVGYAVAVLSETAGLRPSALRIRLDDSEEWLEQPTTFVSFCNSRYTAGSMMMAPEADTADGQLDVIIGKAMGRMQLLAAFPRIFSGTHITRPVIECRRARSVEFAASGEIDFMIDGEVERHWPRRLQVLAGAIDVSV